MDFSATIDLIIKDLQEASDIIDDLKKYPGVPPLQVELAKLKCRSAGEVIGMLKTMQTQPDAVGKEPFPKKQVQKQPEVETDVKVPAFEIIPQPKESVAKEPEIHDTPPSRVVQEAENKKVLKKDQESPILADQFSHLSSRFNEQLGTMKNDEDFGDIMKTQHLDSLSEAIGLNDKFLFIREIFNGNNNDYSLAISRLESAENMKDAMAVIMSYTGDNNESDAVRQLLDLVKRKLPANE
jgi:hypothetical protein